MPFEGTYGTFNEDNSIYRIISSQSQNIIFQGSTCYGAPPHLAGSYDNFGAIVPNSQNGNLVPTPGRAGQFLLPGQFGEVSSGLRHREHGEHGSHVQDLPVRAPEHDGAGRITGRPPWRVLPDITYTRRRTRFHRHGSIRVHAGNPHVYGLASDDLDPTLNNSTGFLGLWKIELVNGGPIQIHAGGLSSQLVFGCIQSSRRGRTFRGHGILVFHGPQGRDRVLPFGRDIRH